MGSPVVVTGALMTCTFGAAPAPLSVLPTNRVVVSKRPAATIQDHVPMVNIPSFGMCSSIANPMVASATAAALGALTPMPCVPATPSPWLPGAMRSLVGRQPALTAQSQCNCMWGGLIRISVPGQFTATAG